MVVNLFDRLHLECEDLLPEQVRYYYLSPAPHGDDGAWTSIDAPVLGLENAKVIEIGAVTVGLEFLWVLFEIFVVKSSIVREKQKYKKE
ncbi:unnamed protein product, partial [Tuber aestivum]